VSPRTVLILSLVGTAIAGADGYYQIHTNGPLDARYWIGLAFASLAPVGSYLMGLVQTSPWDKKPSSGG
jgi:hypothetical protein